VKACLHHCGMATGKTPSD